MAERSYCKVTMFFPLLDNDDEPFDRETWDWWRDEVTKLLSGGYTEMGTVKGWWAGRSDQSLWLVAVIESAERMDNVRSFLRAARLKFRQDTMYLDWHAVEFELVT
jgi:hypothetical protein